MGGRLLRSWVERPLLSPAAISRRLAAVGELVDSGMIRSELTVTLHDIGDIQRLIGRCVYGTANARDLAALGAYFAKLPRLTELLSPVKSSLLQDTAGMDTLADLQADIAALIADDPPFSVREGGMVRPGANDEVDYLRNVRDNGARMVSELEQREREATGIKKLKVGYNKVFGYYIDVPRSAGDAPLPDTYIRKQTLVSNERYFTPELKELENTLLNAKDRVAELEYDLFSQLRDRIAAQVERVQTVAGQVAELDAICSLAEVAVRNHYTKPEIDLSRTLDIRDGRHPVVEMAQKDALFVPNDTFLNDADDRVAIITGPNMAGKSTYMRQTALIVLMAQIGSFVPARSAVIGVVDRVFTRIGASDDLASGQSTFMVEMAEMANILRHATSASLLVLDEIGRGTSTFDGMAIARAMLEYCADRRRLGARTMFATHYHELSALEGTLEGVKNYNITAKKQGGNLIFLRKIVPGSADDSYGIEVAKLAGVPEAIIKKAKQYLAELESSSAPLPMTVTADTEPEQVSLLDMASTALADELNALDLNTITPLEALNLLYKLKKMAAGG
jgi:DNA mismatch repair protein MutS